MIADGMLRAARASTGGGDVIGGHWAIDPQRSRTRSRLATIAALKDIEGAVDVSATELTITAVFDVEHTEQSTELDRRSSSSSHATFPSGTLRARTILWSGEDGLAMGEVSLDGVTRTAAFDVVVSGYSADPTGRERARIAAETEIAAEGDALSPTPGRLRLELELVRDPEPDPTLR